MGLSSACRVAGTGGSPRSKGRRRDTSSPRVDRRLKLPLLWHAPARIAASKLDFGDIQARGLLQAALGFSPVWWHRRILALDLRKAHPSQVSCSPILGSLLRLMEAARARPGRRNQPTGCPARGCEAGMRVEPAPADGRSRPL